MREPARVVIAGAGIAGLATALTLDRHGIGVHVLERASSLGEIGAGIQLSPNATRILDRLGVLGALREVAAEPDRVAIRNASDLRLLAEVPLGRRAQDRWGAPYLTVHRADLQHALANAAWAAKLVSIETGARVIGATGNGSGYAIAVETSEGVREIGASVLIGADGVRSVLRSGIAGGLPDRDTGDVAWRLTVDTARLASGMQYALQGGGDVTTFVNPRAHLVAYPVRGGEQMNLVAVLRGSSRFAPKEDGTLKAALSAMAAPLRGLAAWDNWSRWPIRCVDPTGPWSDGRGLVLVGDAAHAMTPYAAQGAAMAIEDGWELASRIAEHPATPAAAIAAHEIARRPRIRRVAARGAFNQFAWHARWPIAAGRNLILAMRSGERLAADLDWLYGDGAQAVDKLR